MAGKENLDVGTSAQPLKRRADRGERGAEALAAVAGDEHELLRRIERRQLFLPTRAGENEMERVDAAIAGHIDVAPEALGEEVGARRGGGREMQIGGQRDRPAVGFLGKGR